MLHWPFRFVHASDFHLELPLGGVANVPDHLRTAFLESAYQAAERVFDAVLAEEADFLVLSGDILSPLQTGPRGLLFLVEQFERLAQRGVPVYWAGGRPDPPESWPSAIPLPDNVHRFSRARLQEFAFERDDRPLARLIGVSRDRKRSMRTSDFEPDTAGAFSIAVVHTTLDAGAIPARGIQYWALGGKHERCTLLSAPCVAHYPGSPQGRTREEAGPHGCTLVQVDQAERVHTTPIATDAARWLSERVTVENSTTCDDLANLLHQRMQALIEALPTTNLLVSWTVAGDGPIIHALRRGGTTKQLLDRMRKEFGFASPAAWPLSLEVDLPDTLPPDWYQQETICGDFLRTIQSWQANPVEEIDLAAYLSESDRDGELAEALLLSDPAVRMQVLREAACLGLDLLGGEEN